ncbi:hypothetical protein L211DRAFT_845953 [Terfezia boudieri ATCC MYA-4762]|uniref:Uncharacterized protein n=1 Tax=Terfezia boudieri ATCC MYA-4762 TaxID=1051890 RepID=A0A3N4LYJ4_9PEZI|nr:hypothetical protein L211DRAFT_845953 [Terfezia boudieri ATCC MYA-4762]
MPPSNSSPTPSRILPGTGGISSDTKSTPQKRPSRMASSGHISTRSDVSSYVMTRSGSVDPNFYSTPVRPTSSAGMSSESSSAYSRADTPDCHGRPDSISPVSAAASSPGAAAGDWGDGTIKSRKEGAAAMQRLHSPLLFPDLRWHMRTIPLPLPPWIPRVLNGRLVLRVCCCSNIPSSAAVPGQMASRMGDCALACFALLCLLAILISSLGSSTRGSGCEDWIARRALVLPHAALWLLVELSGPSLGIGLASSRSSAKTQSRPCWGKQKTRHTASKQASKASKQHLNIPVAVPVQCSHQRKHRAIQNLPPLFGFSAHARTITNMLRSVPVRVLSRYLSLGSLC